ncbi:MAG: hypothetical protein G01um101413_540 [Parcubacteria group bacterium Gr01-1014_13]|nr:MAG: hypothetical protein G01um101413_540 [Parcubacteria group bacterium Gr01-1014_13]
MPKIAKVKMTANQVGVALDILRDWNQDPKRKGLIKIIAETLDKFVWIQASSDITEELWNEFCAQVEIQGPVTWH